MTGEIRFDDGEPARAEAGIVRTADPEGELEDAELAGEDTVLNVAAEWSVDPMAIKSNR